MTVSLTFEGLRIVKTNNDLWLFTNDLIVDNLDTISLKRNNVHIGKLGYSPIYNKEITINDLNKSDSLILKTNEYFSDKTIQIQKDVTNIFPVFNIVDSNISLTILPSKELQNLVKQTF